MDNGIGTRFFCYSWLLENTFYVLIHISAEIFPKGWKNNNTLQWRHNGHNGVSIHQPHDCLLNRLFGNRSKKTSKPRVTGLCVGNSPVTGEFPAQMASNAENVSIRWRHHVICVDSGNGQNPGRHFYLILSGHRRRLWYLSQRPRSLTGWFITYPVKCGNNLLIPSKTSAPLKIGMG